MERYLVAVNVIGFVYSGFQASCLAYYLATGNYVISSPLRYYFNFSIDQASYFPCIMLHLVFIGFLFLFFCIRQFAG